VVARGRLRCGRGCGRGREGRTLRRTRRWLARPFALPLSRFSPGSASSWDRRSRMRRGRPPPRPPSRRRTHHRRRRPTLIGRHRLRRRHPRRSATSRRHPRRLRRPRRHRPLPRHRLLARLRLRRRLSSRRRRLHLRPRRTNRLCLRRSASRPLGERATQQRHGSRSPRGRGDGTAQPAPRLLPLRRRRGQ
jgi:hypothetical protein